MVSGTRCPACSDQLKEWSESRAAAQKAVVLNFLTSIHPERSDSRLEKANLRAFFAGDFGPERFDLWPERVDYGSVKGIFRT